MERNAAEERYFRTSNFKCLPADCVGIDTLRVRLSKLLFEHVRQELPKLRSDLEEALMSATKQLNVMGDRRSTSADCKVYLTKLSQDYQEVCKAAIGGHYEGQFFNSDLDPDTKSSLDLPPTIHRIRAAIQYLNTAFSEFIRLNGHKYEIDMSSTADTEGPTLQLPGMHHSSTASRPGSPIKMDRGDALVWARLVLVRSRGRELVGNFNPLLISELFWEQCSKWHDLAVTYLNQVHEVCSKFLDILLKDKCPKDLIARVHTCLVQDALKARYDNALLELERIIEDTKDYPINYNHYYTETIYKRRQERNKNALASCIEDATTLEHLEGCLSDHSSARVDVNKAIAAFSQDNDPNMENISCEEALDCLFAIYKVRQLGRAHP